MGNTINLRLLSRENNFNAQTQSYPGSIESHKLSITLPIHATAKKLVVFSPFDIKYLKESLKGYKQISVIKDTSWVNSKVQNDISLSSRNDLSRLSDSIEDNSDLLVLGGFEYLEDVRPLLAWLRDKLVEKQVRVYVYGIPPFGKNIVGYRQWTRVQFTELLEAVGIKNEVVEDSKKGFLLSLSCSSDYYNNFLLKNHLPHSGIQHLIITTEHSGYRVTGGIGSYVKECEVLYGEQAAILIIDNNRDIDLNKITENKWLACQQFLSEERIEVIDAANFDTVGDLVLETLESLLCLYSSIKSIESQEMLLHRTIEAKKLGFIPPGIRLITTCHGSSFHLAKAKRDVLEAENIHVAYREKFTIEESDISVFPTRFLRESYRDSGLTNLDDVSRIIKRLPFDYERIPRGRALKQYRRLLYIGKTSTIKGFDLFLESLLKLYKEYPAVCQQIEEVLVVATSTNIGERYLQNMFVEAGKLFKISMASLDREELLQNLAEHSEDTLALITYKGDNHPLTVLELMATGHDFIAARAGGTSELIPKEFWKDYLVEPSPAAFAEAIKSSFSKIDYRSKSIKNLSARYRKDQKQINDQYSVDFISKLPTLPRPDIKSKTMPVHINVIDTGSKHLLEKTLKSLKQQSLQPSIIRVCMQDQLDKSEDYDRQAVMRLYAGDVLGPNALRDMRSLLLMDDSTTAILAYEMVPTYLGKELKGVLEFHPFSPQLGSAFLQEKYSRRIVGLFKGSSYRNDDFTDWQKCIDIVSKRYVVRVVPRLSVSLVELEEYINEDILKHTSKMAHSFSALPVFDSYILQSELKRFDEIYWGANLRNHLEDIYIRRDDPTILLGSSPALAKAVHFYRNKTPKIVRRSIGFTTKNTYRTLRAARRKLRGRQA